LTEPLGDASRFVDLAVVVLDDLVGEPVHGRQRTALDPATHRDFWLGRGRWPGTLRWSGSASDNLASWAVGASTPNDPRGRRQYASLQRVRQPVLPGRLPVRRRSATSLACCTAPTAPPPAWS
jgi:hypothetical protein